MTEHAQYRAALEAATRIVELMRLLDDGRSHRVGELACKLECSERTVQRYLREMGGAPLYYPVYSEGKGTWRKLV